jgi:hypothetical protein
MTKESHFTPIALPTKEDKLKQKGYAVSNILLSFISEFDKNERFSVIGVLYNRLRAKGLEFEIKQRDFYVRYSTAIKKKKPLPKKSKGLINYEIGVAVASKAWNMTVEELKASGKNNSIIVSSMFQSIWRREGETIKLLYGLTDENIKDFVKMSSAKGHVFNTLKVANTILSNVDKCFDDFYDIVEKVESRKFQNKISA